MVDRSTGEEALASGLDSGGAELVAALMNGDLAALAKAAPETLARCRAALLQALWILRPIGRPSVGAATFPQV